MLLFAVIVNASCRSSTTPVRVIFQPDGRKDVDNDTFYSCAVEGLCNRPKGDKQLITARHLLAAALNCHLTNGPNDCSGTDIEDIFMDCDAACAANDVYTMAECYPQIDCYNNGGQWVDYQCVLGSCSMDGYPCGADAGDCAYIDGYYNVCVPFPGNCHDNPLDATMILWEPPSHASPKMCSAANKSKDTLFDAPACMP